MPRTVRLDPGDAPLTHDDAPTLHRENASTRDERTRSDGPIEEDTTTTQVTTPFRPAKSTPPPALVPGALKRTARRCPACSHAFSGEIRFCPFDGDELVEAPDYAPSTDPLLGAIVGERYQVVGVIGEGGMGTVYEVRHTTLGRSFALKVLRRDMADPELTARFIQEAKAAAAIGHPNIVQVSDFGELEIGGPGPATTVPYFVMEHLEGVSLAQVLRAEGRLSAERVAAIVEQCASGLAAAHKAGVIHRDLKPDNVFLTRHAEKEWVKLLDFGVAKMAGAGKLTRAGMVFGTPHYMSPEQAAGNPIDHRADIYALGVILYECLAGKVPFEADTYMGVLTKHMFAVPEPLEAVAPRTASLGALGPIVMRCLAKTPADRFADMTELAQALGAVVANPSNAAASSLGPAASDKLKLLATDERFDARGSRMSAPVVPTTPLVPRLVAFGAAAIVIAFSATALILRASAPPVAAAPSARAPAANAPIATTSPSASAAPTATAAASEPASASSTIPASAPPSATAPTSQAVAKPKSGGRPSKPAKSGDIVNPWAN